MKKLLSLILLLAFTAVACAAPQQTTPFNQFVTGLPSAGNPTAPDAFYILQGGNSRKITFGALGTALNSASALLNTANLWLQIQNFSAGIILSGKTATAMSGNSGVLQTVTGPVINGGCASGDSNGNIIWGAGPCVSSSSGVTAGIAGQAAYYATTGSVVSGASNVGTFTSISTGGNTGRTLADRANDQGVSILDFGADPTGSADSTTAIQAAIDYAFNNKPKRAVYCPAGNYKVSLPIYLDPPGSMRGPDGTNGANWSGGGNFQINDMVNFNGVPYIGIQATNINHQPDISPTWWRPLNYDATHTYALNDMVRSQGQIWLSQENSNLNNTPSLGGGATGPPGLPWQIFWNNSFLANQFSTTFYGEKGEGSFGNGQGCSLIFQYQNGPAIVVGAIDGNTLADMTIGTVGGLYSYRGLNAGNGIGVAIAGDGGGAAHTWIKNVEIDGFLQGSVTGFNVTAISGQNGLGEENTWENVAIGNCAVGIALSQSQNYIDTVIGGGANCSNGIITTAGPGINVYGGDWSPIPTKQNIFTLTGTAISSVFDGGVGAFVYTMTTTLGGGLAPNGLIGPPGGGAGSCDATHDCFINACAVRQPTNIGNCVYNAWILKLPGWGFVPMTMTAYNFTTHAATFKIDNGWGQQTGATNLLNNCPGEGGTNTCDGDFNAEVTSASIIYAVEQATIFTGIAFNVTGTHIEPSTGGCIQFFKAQSGFASVDRGAHFENIKFQYDVSGGDFRGNNPTTDPAYGIFACQQAKAFLDAGSNNSAGLTFLDSNFEQGVTPVIIYQPPTPQKCVFDNQGGQLGNVVLVGNPFRYSQCEFKQPWLYGPGSGLRGNNNSITELELGMYGIVPMPWSHPRIQQSDFTTLQSITSGNSIYGYPFIYGNIFYSVLDGTGGSSKLVQSNHAGVSYGRNITTADNASLSWSYIGGTYVVNMDATSLGWMFPGLVIGLDNGSGNQYYSVTGVYPVETLDGGTHPGFVTVTGAVPAHVSNGPNGILYNGGNNTMLIGTAGATPTTYTCPGSCPSTIISQQPYVWQQIGAAQPLGTPNLTSCGTSSALASGSTNLAGAFTTGSSGTPTACTLNFSSAFQNAANCTISAANSTANGVSGGTYISTQSTSLFTITLGTGTNSAKYNYVCSGN